MISICYGSYSVIQEHFIITIKLCALKSRIRDKLTSNELLHKIGENKIIEKLKLTQHS